MQQSDPPLSVVRQKVLEAFESMGQGDGHCSEKTLLEGGYVVGRRFCRGSFGAVWLAGEHCLRLFNEAGELIDTKALDATEVPAFKLNEHGATTLISQVAISMGRAAEAA